MMKKASLIIFFLLTVVSCKSDNSSSNACLYNSGTSSELTSVLTLYSIVENNLMTISSSTLSSVGDSNSGSGSGVDYYIERHLPGSDISSPDFDETTEVIDTDVSSDLFTGKGLSAVDSGFIYDEENVLAPFKAPSEEWYSPLLAYRAFDPNNSSNPIENFNNAGDMVNLNLPCDTSSCTTNCSCVCYRWDFSKNRWTQSGIETTQLSPTQVTCQSAEDHLYAAVFAVKDSCL